MLSSAPLKTVSEALAGAGIAQPNAVSREAAPHPYPQHSPKRDTESVLQAVAGSRHRLWRWVDRVSPRAVHDENAGMTSLANNRADDMTWSPGMPGSAVQDVISVTPSSSRSRATCAIASSGVPMM